MGTSELPRDGLLRVDAWLLREVRAAADWMVAQGCPDPALPVLVRIAAAELERFYTADRSRDGRD